jgi:hypothetical protein
VLDYFVAVVSSAESVSWAPEISGGNESHIQFPDIDIIGESEEVAPIGASSGNHH